MSTIRISGDSSGYYDLTVPSAAGTNTIDLSTLPTATNLGTSSITHGSNTGDTRFTLNSANQYTLRIQNAGNIAGQIGGGGTDDLRFSNAAGATTMQIKNGVVIKPTQPMLKVGLASGAYLTGTNGKIPFNSFASSQVFDPEDNMSAFNTSTSTYTIPSGLGGLWHITSHIYTTGSNANQLAVYVNGSREDAIGPDNGTSPMNQGSIVKRFAAGDEIQMWCFFGSALTVQPNLFHTYWQMNFLG